jgi:hypothetical protein
MWPPSRIGPTARWTFSDNGPSVAAVVQWSLAHRFRTGPLPLVGVVVTIPLSN